MKNPIIALFFLFSLGAASQEKVTQIETLPRFSESGKFTLAMKFQLGVMGRDYLGEEFIGMAPAETVSSFNSLFPVDGFKHAMCGNLLSYYIRSRGTIDPDDDVHFIIKPIARPEFGTGHLINEHNLQMSQANLAQLNHFPATKKFAPLISSPNVFSEEGVDAYNKTIQSIRMTIQGLNQNNTPSTFPVILREMKKEVLGEVDLTDHKIIPEYSSHLPRQELNCACIYGAWVNDRLAVPVVGSFHDFLEIHPVQQVWWTFQRNTNETEYYLGAFGDASGHFYDRSHYDTDGGKLSFNGPWISCPANDVFAIPFEIKSNMPVLTYSVEKKVNIVEKGLASSPTVHTLMFGNTVLIRVSEEYGLDIQFEKVGIDRVVGVDTLIKGFVVIRNLTQNAECPEMVFAKVTANTNIKRPIAPTAIQQPPIVKVTLKSIECRSANDSGSPIEEIFGYAGVTYPHEQPHVVMFCA